MNNALRAQLTAAEAEILDLRRQVADALAREHEAQVEARKAREEVERLGECEAELSQLQEAIASSLQWHPDWPESAVLAMQRVLGDRDKARSEWEEMRRERDDAREEIARLERERDAARLVLADIHNTWRHKLDAAIDAAMEEHFKALGRQIREALRAPAIERGDYVRPASGDGGKG